MGNTTFPPHPPLYCHPVGPGDKKRRRASGAHGVGIHYIGRNVIGDSFPFHTHCQFWAKRRGVRLRLAMPSMERATKSARMALTGRNEELFSRRARVAPFFLGQFSILVLL